METLQEKMQTEQPIAITGTFSGCCSTQMAFGVDFAVLTLCHLKLVEIFE